MAAKLSLVRMALVVAVLAAAVIFIAGASAGAAAGAAAGSVEGLANNSDTPSVVMILATSWCGWSKKMQEEVDGVRQGLKGLATVKVLDDKSSEGKSLASKHGVDGYPATLVLSSDGGLVGKPIGGYQKAGDLVSELKRLL